MAKPRKAYRPREAMVPMIVMPTIVPTFGAIERIAIEAFAQGFAETDHFDNLADCLDILGMAAYAKRDADTLAMCEAATIAMFNIRDRYKAGQGLTADQAEVDVLHHLVDVSNDFWCRAGTALFMKTFNALEAARKEQKRDANEAAQAHQAY